MVKLSLFPCNIVYVCRYIIWVLSMWCSKYNWIEEQPCSHGLHMHNDQVVLMYICRIPIFHFQIFFYEISKHSLLRPFNLVFVSDNWLPPLTRIIWTPQLLFNPWRKSRHYTQKRKEFNKNWEDITHTIESVHFKYLLSLVTLWGTHYLYAKALLAQTFWQKGWVSWDYEEQRMSHTC